MSNQDISSTEWRKFTLIHKNGEKIDLWLAGINKKWLFGSDIVAVACYEIPLGANIVDIREEEREIWWQGSSSRDPAGKRWQIILRIGDMTITKVIRKFYKTQSGTDVVLISVWGIEHGKIPDNNLLDGISFEVY